MSVNVGYTLPSFQSDPDVLVAVARGAEEHGVDGVFVYDHLFRDKADRPAIEMGAALGAVGAATSRITIGTLVARVVTRPPATLVTMLDTAHRIAAHRFVATLGTGDEQSDPEHVAYGLPIPTLETRLEALEQTLAGAAGHGYPLWVGGASRAVWRVAARYADGWNRWGGTAETFARQTERVRATVLDTGRDPEMFAPTWGGLVALGATDADAQRKLKQPRDDVFAGSPATVAALLEPFVAAGARWLILGPVDSANADNAALIAEIRARLLG
jgi:alkanesulfonate monooxygenase SsuD/methylene tetrahydromethanopterin reductase-like flavin-dependent oxidoreductase (luciferase family)